MPQLLTINAPLTINGLQVTIEAAATFAPVVRFHPKEQYFPCSIEFLLANSTLVVGSTETPNPTFDDLYAARHASDADNAHLRIARSGRPGMPPQNNVIPAPMYVAPQVAADRSFVDFTYYFLSAFNGPQAVFVHLKNAVPLKSFNCAIEQFAFHQGDVESITVRVTPDFSKVIHVGMAAHGDYTYYLPDELAFESTTHPLVSCAVFSHASYNSLDASRFIDPSNHTEYKVLLDVEDIGWQGISVGQLEFMDDISWGDVVWRPFSEAGGVTAPNGQLVFVGFDGSIDHPINGQTWASFRGDLGERRSNKYIDVIPIREDLSIVQETAFKTGEMLGEALDKIPIEYMSGNGPDGFGKRLDRMMLANPVDLAEQTVMVGSRLSPMFVLGVDSANPTGDVTLRPLEFGVPPAFYHHWTQVTYGHDTSPIVLINDGSQMAAGVLAGSGVGTVISQFPANYIGVGQKWSIVNTEFSSGPIGLQAIYNQKLSIGAHTPDFWGPPVVLDQGASSTDRSAQWGIVPIVPGKSMLALIAMYRSSHDNTLWWSAFDPVGENWMPDAPIGGGMSAASGAALAALSGQLVAVFRGTDSQLWWSAYNANGRQWQQNQPFGQGMRTSAAPALAVLNDTLYCVHCGVNDDGLWWSAFDTNTNTWVKDRELGHGIATPSGAALAVVNGVLYCVHRGNDNGLWWTTFDPATSTWTPDRSFGPGEKTSAAPALAVLDGTLYCVCRGMDQQLWWTTYNPEQPWWHASQWFGPGIATSAGPSLTAFNGCLYCAYKDAGGQNLWWAMFDPALGTWSNSTRFTFDIRSQDAPAILNVV